MTTAEGKGEPTVPAPIRRPGSEATFSYRCLKFFGLPLLRLLFRVRGVGTENVPRSGPVILASNHVSYIDPLVLGAACPRPVHYMMLRRFWEMPLIGTISRMAGSFPVEQEGPATRALRQALGILREGKVLGIFPEGGRSPDGSLMPAKPGVALLALKSGYPLVPAMIDGAERALPKGKAIPRPVRITVRFGPPLTFSPPERNSGKDYLERVTGETMAAISALKDPPPPLLGRCD